jgi:hypothetical protein
MRNLATIQVIDWIKPIKDADQIELCGILGWQCVIAKKDNFRIGDKVLYVEIDSVLPEKPEFEFLRSRNFRIRTIKLKGEVSQGLVLPLKALTGGYVNPNDIEVGKDVTDLIGVTKYLSPSEKEEFLRNETKLRNEKNKLKKFLSRYSWFRKLFYPEKIKQNFPYWVAKTDEARVQNIPQILNQFADKEVYITEKVDCLDENTLILTVQGLQTIKEICESDNKTFVLSQDIETKKVSFKPVLNKMIKPNENKTWVKITLDDDTELLVTDDHRVWLPDLQCYRQVKDLTENDFLLKLC